MNITNQECVLILLLETTQLAVWKIDPAAPPNEAPTPREEEWWPSFEDDSFSSLSLPSFLCEVLSSSLSFLSFLWSFDFSLLSDSDYFSFFRLLFSSTFLIFPSLSLVKCSDTTVPSYLVTWTA